MKFTLIPKRVLVQIKEDIMKQQPLRISICFNYSDGISGYLYLLALKQVLSVMTPQTIDLGIALCGISSTLYFAVTIEKSATNFEA